MKRVNVYGKSSSAELEVVLCEGAPWASLATATGAAGGSCSSATALHWASADGMYPQEMPSHFWLKSIDSP